MGISGNEIRQARSPEELPLRAKKSAILLDQAYSKQDGT
jgi:hypothetical protein